MEEGYHQPGWFVPATVTRNLATTAQQLSATKEIKMAILMVLLAALAGRELSIWRANAHVLSICFIVDRYKTTADSNVHHGHLLSRLDIGNYPW